MAKYLFEAHYTAEGTKGLAREGGSGRREAVTKVVESVGGKLEAFYYAFGPRPPRTARPPLLPASAPSRYEPQTERLPRASSRPGGAGR